MIKVVWGAVMLQFLGPITANKAEIAVILRIFGPITAPPPRNSYSTASFLGVFLDLDDFFS